MRLASSFMALLLCGITSLAGSADSQPSLRGEFLNAEIGPLSLAIGKACRRTVVCDSSVVGKASIRLEGLDIGQALATVASQVNCLVWEYGNVWYLDTIKVIAGNESLQLAATGVPWGRLFERLRQSGIQVSASRIPDGTVDLPPVEVPIERLASLLSEKAGPDWSIRHLGDTLRVDRLDPLAPERLLGRTVKPRENGNWDLSLDGTNGRQVLECLLQAAGRSYRIPQDLGNCTRLVLFDVPAEKAIQAICVDLGIKADQDKDPIVLERKTGTKSSPGTVVLHRVLLNITAQRAKEILPLSISRLATSLEILDAHSLIATGTDEAVSAIASCLDSIDRPELTSYWQWYEYQGYGTRDYQTLLMDRKDQVVLVPDGSGFMAYADVAGHSYFGGLSDLIRQTNVQVPLQLQYMSSEDLLRNMIPGLSPSQFSRTHREDLLFFAGSPAQLSRVKESLKLLDRPKQQLKYHILILQYQKSDGEQKALGLSAMPWAPGDRSVISGSFKQILGLGFDVVSAFGLTFALDLEGRLARQEARVVADTTIHGLANQDLRLQSTVTSRYLQSVRDTDPSVTDKVGVLREVSSGLILALKGSVSGEGMVTLDIQAHVSKELSAPGEPSTDLPSTSERIFQSRLQTRSGVPVMLGGLELQEAGQNRTSLPLLGWIPFLGDLLSDSETRTERSEIAIYVIPVVERNETRDREERYQVWIRKAISGGQL